MTKLWLSALVLAVMATGVHAQDGRYANADDNAHYGWPDVLRADPVQGVTRTEVPRQECYEQPVVRREGGNSTAGTVLGAVIGGVLGNTVGKGDGRKAATVVGAVAGGALVFALPPVAVASTKPPRPSVARSARSASSAGSSATTWNTAIAARSTRRA